MTREAFMPATTATAPDTAKLGPRMARTIFNDGTFCVIVRSEAVSIGKDAGNVFAVPRGHAYFDRVAEADTRVVVDSLYEELCAAFA